MAQEDNKEQLGFFQDTTPTATPKKEKCTAIPIYRVSLVRESRLHCYHKQIRSSADAGALLHAYLEGVDREHFVVLLLDQKNKVIGINNVSILHRTQFFY
jgi:DNA repair protein RadC